MSGLEDDDEVWEDPDDYWEQQAELPLRQRDGLWWVGVALPNVLAIATATTYVTILVGLIALGLLDVL